MGQSHFGRSNTNLYLANAREVNLWLRDLQRVWFGGWGDGGGGGVVGEGLFLVSSQCFVLEVLYLEGIFVQNR